MTQIPQEADYIDITLDTLEICPEALKKQNRCNIESAFSYFNPFFLLVGWLCIAVFVIQIMNGLFSLGDSVDMTNFTFKYSNYRLWGNPLGIVSSIFLHGGIEHLAGNMLFLYLLGLISFRIVGFLDSMIVFIATGFLAWLTSYYLGTMPAIGASGAIFGMFGFVSIFYMLERENLIENLEDLSWVMIISAILQVISGFAVSYIDNYAHFGGFVSGCIIGYIYFRRHRMKFSNT